MLKKYRRYSPLLFVIPLCLSAYTHLWNPIEFPNIHADEGTYLLRSVTFLKDNTLLPQGAPFYDHPFFGQIFVASVMALFGYPDSMGISADGDLSSVEKLYLFPRVLMGFLAVVDTFLVYKIAERKYNRTVALIAAILFAVMPISWILRRILLDSILLPFLLSSILFTTYIKSENKAHDNERTKKVLGKKCFVVIMLSGIFLGLAIFTKVPAFTFIPLVSFFVFTNSSRNWKALGLWFIPVVLIPAIWPISAYSVGQFDNWFDAIVRQATERADKPLIDALHTFFQIDPVLLIIGISGIIFTCLRKDLFILLSVVPYLIFLQLVEFVSVYHLILLLPSICIASSVLIYRLSIKLKNKKVKVVPLAVVTAIFVFGLLMSNLLINTSFNSSYFKAYAVFVEQLTDKDPDPDPDPDPGPVIPLATLRNSGGPNDEETDNDPPIVVGRFWTKSFLWATQYAFDKNFILIREDGRGGSVFGLDEVIDRVNDDSIIFVVDNNINRNMKTNSADERYELLRTLHNLTYTVQTIEGKSFDHDRSVYPYRGLYDNRGIGDIEIRSN